MSTDGASETCQILPFQRCGPFADAALDLYQHGLAVLPVGGDDGKVPKIQWGKWKRPIGRDCIGKLTEKFGTANIGIVCHLSGVTVVDIDTAEWNTTEVDQLVATMLARCGDTPLRTKTPSGGVHLWYRHNGERCANLRVQDGLPVDVKGVDGFVVVPPSVRPSGAHAGKSYAFLAGSWADLERLPKIKAGSLTGKPGRFDLHGVEEGQRGNALFKLLLREVQFCDTYDDLLDVARTLGSQCTPPYEDARVVATTKSVWKMEQEGRNWTGKEAHIVTTASEFTVLSANPDALMLFMLLRWKHDANPSSPFAVASKNMAAVEVLPGWTDARRYSRARDWLRDHRFLKLEHQGCRKGDPSLFSLQSGAYCQGALDAPNITEHPLPLASDRASDQQQGSDSLVAVLADPDMARQVRERCRDARLAEGLTLKQAAKRCGWSPPTYGNYEAGRKGTSPATLLRMALAFDVRVA